ncbi:hypothetical protein KI387_019064, partial [Taxus chinensis]
IIHPSDKWEGFQCERSSGKLNIFGDEGEDKCASPLSTCRAVMEANRSGAPFPNVNSVTSPMFRDKCNNAAEKLLTPESPSMVLDWGAIEETFLAKNSKGLLLAEMTLKFKKYGVRFYDCTTYIMAVSRSIRQGLDWGAIEETFLAETSRGLFLVEMTLKFKKYSVQFFDCTTCVVVMSRSIRSYTSRFLFDNCTFFVSEYLDSKTLHQALTLAHDDLVTIASISSKHNTGKTMPFYVLDLCHDRPLMLDHFHQVITFRDMVVTMKSRSSQTMSDYNCNGCHVLTWARNLERLIVGALLQSMWGMSPTHLSWSPQHNITLVDYTQSIGQTPFGPFSRACHC